MTLIRINNRYVNMDNVVEIEDNATVIAIYTNAPSWSDQGIPYGINIIVTEPHTIYLKDDEAQRFRSWLEANSREC